MSYQLWSTLYAWGFFLLVLAMILLTARTITRSRATDRRAAEKKLRAARLIQLEKEIAIPWDELIREAEKRAEREYAAGNPQPARASEPAAVPPQPAIRRLQPVSLRRQIAAKAEEIEYLDGRISGYTRYATGSFTAAELSVKILQLRSKRLQAWYELQYLLRKHDES